MIARIWHGWTTPENADAYEALLNEEIFVGIKKREIQGFKDIPHDLGLRKGVIMIRMYITLAAIGLVLSSCGSAGAGKGPVSLVTYSKQAGVAYQVLVDAHHAYIANNDGVAIFDVRQPERPRKIGELPLETTFGVCVENGLAYVPSGNRLTIWDVHDPANPRRLAECAVDDGIRNVCLDGPHAYVSGERGVHILDVRDPGSLRPVARCGEGGARSVAVRDGIAYVAMPAAGVVIMDVTNPATPRQIATVSGTKGAWDLHLHESWLYVGCHGAGVRILALSGKEAPRIVGSYRDEDGGEALGVWGDGRHLFVADNYGIEVLNVEDPANPRELAEYDGLRGAHDIFVVGSFIYVAEAKKGLIVFELKQGQ